MDQEKLRQFLIASNRAGYASGNENNWTKESDGSTAITFEQGEWKSHDNFFGGEPYGGRVIVFYDKKPCWIMVYYGWVKEGVDTNSVYKILRNALKQMPDIAPYRGPSEYLEDNFKYTNSWSGEISRYSGEEQITENSNLIYKANYMGGLVDQNAGV